MGLILTLLLALGLCFDSFAVSLSSGMIRCEVCRWKFFRFALVLAVFQAGLTFAGWAMAEQVRGYISHFDHWISFILLTLLGAKMIKESFADDDRITETPFDLRKNCMLGFATSIDAVISGIALAFIHISILPDSSQLANISVAALIILLVTFAASIVGLLLGRRASGRLGARAELFGGVILILIGLKVLVEHLLS